LFCWKFLPETKGLTLEDIGRFWLHHHAKGEAVSSPSAPCEDAGKEMSGGTKPTGEKGERR
jgi:hypothetical protein